MKIETLVLDLGWFMIYPAFKMVQSHAHLVEIVL